MLCAAGLLTYTAQDKYILYAAPVNMWLALCSGVLGSFTASAFIYRKFSVHDLIFSGLSVTNILYLRVVLSLVLHLM